jgi:hypothetical protein
MAAALTGDYFHEIICIRTYDCERSTGINGEALFKTISSWRRGYR